MWIDRQEIKESTENVKRFFGRSSASNPKPGKYPLDHKLYHHAIAVVTVAAIGTGILMMFRVTGCGDSFMSCTGSRE
jgi:hypothetical protein